MKFTEILKYFEASKRQISPSLSVLYDMTQKHTQNVKYIYKNDREEDEHKQNKNMTLF
jgi:hypothetical protein